MKTALFFAVWLCCTSTFAQSKYDVYYKQIFDAKYMDKPPVFIAGKDSLQRVYYRGFPAFDSLIGKCIRMGDTNKYIRVYFSFIVDAQGICYEPKFYKITSTRSKVANKSSAIKYFFEDKKLYQDAIKQMLFTMPFWRPGLQTGIPVSAIVEDYFQFWIGPDEPVE